MSSSSSLSSSPSSECVVVASSSSSRSRYANGNGLSLRAVSKGEGGAHVRNDTTETVDPNSPVTNTSEGSPVCGAAPSSSLSGHRGRGGGSSDNVEGRRTWVHHQLAIPEVVDHQGQVHHHLDEEKEKDDDERMWISGGTTNDPFATARWSHGCNGAGSSNKSKKFEAARNIDQDDDDLLIRDQSGGVFSSRPYFPSAKAVLNDMKVKRRRTMEEIHTMKSRGKLHNAHETLYNYWTRCDERRLSARRTIRICETSIIFITILQVFCTVVVAFMLNQLDNSQKGNSTLKWILVSLVITREIADRVQNKLDIPQYKRMATIKLAHFVWLMGKIEMIWCDKVAPTADDIGEINKLYRIAWQIDCEQGSTSSTNTNNKNNQINSSQPHQSSPTSFTALPPLHVRKV